MTNLRIWIVIKKWKKRGESQAENILNPGSIICVTGLGTEMKMGM